MTIFDDGAGMGGTVISVGAVAKFADQPVAVLQDGDTVSSGEAVLTAFRGLDNTRSFGGQRGIHVSEFGAPALRRSTVGSHRQYVCRPRRRQSR